MEPSAEPNWSRSAAFLGSALSLSLPPEFGKQVLELCCLQAALLRRRRLRELADTDRRRRQYLRRRRAFLLSSIAAILSLTTPTSRHTWVRNRSPGDNFWAMTECFNDEEWKAQFRVSRATFDHVLDLIGPAITRRRTNCRAPIEPRRRLAIALWWYARSGEYRSIANLFGVGLATVCVIVRQVTSAIVDLLYPRFVALPGGTRLDETIRTFKERRYPQCAGAIGRTHIPIAPPRANPDHYYNRRGWHSIILQAVVDQNLCFTDVYAGWPGRSSSFTVLASSELYLKAEDRPDGYLFPRERSVMSAGVEIPVHLIGDASFPLRPWLMKGYGHRHQLSPQQRRFNRTLQSARSVIGTSFARLKGRWRCLLKRNDIDNSMMSRVVVACCILHNICENQKDDFPPEWDSDTVPSANDLLQPDVESYDADAYGAAEVIRDAITHGLLTSRHD